MRKVDICTLAAPYALMESLVLQLANLNHSTKHELPLLSNVCMAMF
jgi:hypothetical protein